jgi:hypothetical protein
LDTAQTEAIRLIESNDIVGYFKEFAPPDFLATFPPGTTFEQIAEELPHDPKLSGEMQNLLGQLYSIQGQTPIMSADGDTATYNATMADGRHTHLGFKKANGLWYIVNF